MKWILLSCVLFSCSIFQKKGDVSRLDDLINSGMSKEEVSRSIRQGYQEGKNYISVGQVGLFPKYIIFFNDKNIIQEISYFVSEKEIVQKLSEIRCNWHRAETWKSFNHGDFIKRIKAGKCLDKKISFKYRNKSGKYEIRWKTSVNISP